MNNKSNILLIIGIIFIAATLRAPLTAVGPIVEQIKAHIGINNTLAGLLTTIPLLMFGVMSPFVAGIAAKLSMPWTVFLATGLLSIGLILRISGGLPFFIIGTMIIGIAIAFSNVTLPGYVKWKFPLQVGLVTGIYSATINFTAGLGGGLSYPLYKAGGLTGSLAFWLLPAVSALVIWLPQLKQTEIHHAAPAEHMKLSRTRLAWIIALTMGLQSMIFYSTVTWIPSIMMDRGIEPAMAGWYLMFNQFAQVPMTFLFPVIAARMKQQQWLVVIIGVLYIAGFSLLFSSQWILAAMILSGLAGGASFSLCMTLFSIRAQTQEGSIALSGFGQSGGYFIASAGPLMLGFLHDMTHSWNIDIIALLVMVAGFMIFGLSAAKDRMIEDEI